MGSARRWRRRRSSRPTSRASSTATSSRQGAKRDERDAHDATSTSRSKRCRRGSARRAAKHAPLRIRGGGTKDFYGERARRRRARHAASYAGIVDYEPTELVITARAGTPLADDRERDARARPDARVRAAALRRRRRRSAARSPRDCPGRAAPMPARCATSCSACEILDGTRRATRVRRPRDEERRGLRRVAPDDGRARHARRAHRSLAQVPAAAASVEATRVLRVLGRRGDPAASTNGAASRCRCRRPAFTTAGSRCGCPARRPAVEAAVREARRRRRAADARRVLGERARAHASRSSSRRARRARRCGGCRSSRRAPYTDLGGEQLIEWGGALRWLAADERTDPRTRARVGARATAATRRCSAPPTRRSTCSIRCRRRCSALHRRLKAVFDPARHPQSRPAVPGSSDGRMQTNLARRFHPRHARGPRSRRDPARVRALRLLHGDLPDLSAARRRARRPARPHLPHQAGARGRARSPRRRSCTSTAASPAAAARRRARRACKYGRLVDIGRHVVEASVGRARPRKRAQRWSLRKTLLSRGAVRRRARRWAGCVKGLLPRELARSHSGAAHGRRVAGAAAPAQDARRSKAACSRRSRRASTRRCARVLDRIGISLAARAGGGCCGALPHHLSGRGRGARHRPPQHRRLVAARRIAASRRSSSRRAAAA